MGHVFKKITASIGATLCILSLGCATGKTSSTTAADSSPTTTPNISQILPQTIPVGAPSQSIRVLGTNFADQAVILWNGGAISTTRIDANTLSGAVDSSVLTSPATIQLQVKNTSDGRQSSAVPLTVAPAASNTAPILSIASSILSSGTSGVAYAQSLQAGGGTAPYGWAITSGILPNGLTLDPATGIIAGTPSLAGTFSFTAGLADNGTPIQTATAATSITIAPTPLAITNAILASSTINLAYSQALQASGGTPGYTWSLAAGSLPAGLTLGANGSITGTPTVAGTFNFTASVSDSGSPAQTRTVATSLAIAATQLSITSSSLAGATNGIAYSQSLQAAGGTPAYNWSVATGSLPAGLTLSASGLVSGTPTVAGTFNFTASVSDSGSPVQSQTAATSIAVLPSQLTITTASLASTVSGTVYTQTLQAAGGTPSYTWALTSGTLPTGLTLSPAGAIAGTPTVAGTFTFTVTVTDGASQTKSLTASIAVSPSSVLTILSAALSSGTNGTAYSQSLQAAGGTPSYTWTVTSGTLPAGLTLSTTGAVTGTPAVTGSFPVTVTVADSSIPSQTTSASTTIVIAPTTLAITSGSLVNGTSGTAYSQTLTASGGTSGYTWTVASGTLPAGLALSTTGVVSGTPTAAGASNFTVTVTDSGSPAQSKSISTTIVIANTTLTITSSSVAGANKGTPYSQSLSATGGTPAYTWTVTAGTLPAGLTLSTAGVVSGIPTATGTSNFTVTVTDASSPAQTKTLSTSIVVAATALTITSSPPPSGTKGTAYSQSLTAAGGTPSYIWTVTAGTLPTGLSLSTAGMLTGTPTASGTFTFTATVTDSDSPVQTKSASLSVAIAASAVSITSSSLPSGTAGTAYSQSLSATGGTPGYSWTVTSGSLPAGLTLSSAGIVTGTPTASGTSNFTVTLTDAGSPAQNKSAAISVVIAAGPLTITSSSFISGTTGIAFAQSLSATGGTPGYTWTITSGSLPAGLTLAATTGVVSGNPTVLGTSTFTATVTDNSSPAQTKSVSTSIVVIAAVAGGPGTTWYVRLDGGTRYSASATAGQCDGKADAPYGGVGTNQHCAFSDYRYLWDDQTWQSKSWVIAGGDTVILRGGPWRVGFNQGISPNDSWCRGGNGPFDCWSPAIPAGTASQHTRILGENYASCGATNKTQVFGGYGVNVALNLSGAQYVDISCMEVTRHSQCTRHGYPAFPAGCSSSFPLDDYDSDGVTTDPNTHDLTMTDVWIHGHTDRGIIGSIGANVTCLRCNISYNGMAGWDFDDGYLHAAYGPNASWNLLYSVIEWNGCNQEYPITHPNPAISCYSQSTGGYGDGVGNPANTGNGMDVNVDHSTFRFNTQDGIDLGHADAGIHTLNISNSLSYSNNGGSFKWGAYFQSVNFSNNIALENCSRMSNPIPGTPSTFNVNLTDYCRAEDAISFNFLQNGTATFLNNTVVSYAPTTFDINCWDASCSNSTLTFKNNLVLAYDNPTTYNSGGQPGGPGLFYYQAPIGHVIRSNNLFSGIRNVSCPTGNSGEICLSPLFTNQPSGTAATFVESELDNFNFNLTPGSPAKGAGISLPAMTIDYNSVLRSNPPTIGAIE